MRKIFLLTLLGLVSTAQAAVPILTKNFNFLKSSFCTTQYRCVAAGTVKELGIDQATAIVSEHYQVFTRKPMPKHFYIPGTNVIISKIGSNIETVAVHHPRAQDDIEDGTFSFDFFGFMSGVNLNQLVGKASLDCTITFKSSPKGFVIIPTDIGYMWTERQFRLLEAIDLEAPIFQDIPKGQTMKYLSHDACWKQISGE